MDTPKRVKNVQPTIKLSDIDFVPIFIGVLVILVTLGERGSGSVRSTAFHFFSFHLMFSHFLLVEKENVEAYDCSIDRPL